MLSLAIPNAATAQSSNSLFSATPSTGLISPGQGVRGDGFGPGGVLAPSSQAPVIMPNSANPTAPMPMVPAGKVALALSARFVAWRVLR